MPPAFFAPQYSYNNASPVQKRQIRETVKGKDGYASTATDDEDMADQPTSPAVRRPRKSTASHKRLVFYDPIAFRYLEEDPTTIVLDRRRKLEGYEIYLVEQWACSRTHPTFLICTYTGDASKSILASVLSVPSDPDAWSPRMKLYFEAVGQFHGRERETPFGTIMVTNLSGFPSALTVIPVPDGDVKKHREDFIVNEDLKRMGCSGRAAISLQSPQSSTIAKFHQLYHTSESAGIYPAVMELVKLIQTALMFSGKLEEAYVDGLLCDLTEKAVGDWWTDIGVYFYNSESSDGILGPTTVSAILGLMIGAYNRLKSFGAPVGKDILDRAAMKRAIGSFQKAAKLERTRRLDRETLDRLHRATAKVASGEGWSVGKALKSTVTDVTGKGGEMVMGIVGGREKAAIAAAETLEIDQLSQVVVGPKMKWLWQGKQKPSDLFGSPSDGLDGKVFSTDDQGGFIWTSNNREGNKDRSLERVDTFASSHTTHTDGGRSGIGRIKDTARGLKSHARVPKEGDMHHEHTDGQHPASRKVIGSRPTTPTESRKSLERHHDITMAMNTSLGSASADAKGHARDASFGSPLQSGDSWKTSYRQQLKPAAPAESPRKRQIRGEMAQLREDLRGEVYQDFSNDFEYSGPSSKALRRSVSAVQIVEEFPGFPRQNRMNRQMSFSIVEGSILRFHDAMADMPTHMNSQLPTYHGPIDQMTIRDAQVAALQKKVKKVLLYQQALANFAQSRVDHVDSLDHDAQEHLEILNTSYYQKLEDYQTLRATSSDVVAQEKGTLNESLRRVEMLGNKLDYELNALHSRMQEVEDGIDEFEKNVIGIENRVKELAGTEERDSTPWSQRLLNFLQKRK